MYVTTVITTVRATITHDKPFSDKQNALENFMDRELLDYASILGTDDGDMRVSGIEIVEDTVENFNIDEEEMVDD